MAQKEYVAVCTVDGGDYIEDLFIVTIEDFMNIQYGRDYIIKDGEYSFTILNKDLKYFKSEDEVKDENKIIYIYGTYTQDTIPQKYLDEKYSRD